MNKGYYYKFPIGKMGIVEDSGAIVRVFFCSEKRYAALKGSFDLVETDFKWN